MAPIKPDSHCDVLIVGAGPAGLMAANSMARLGVHARVIDKRGSAVLNGQADGISARTMEIFDSMGLAGRIFDEAAAGYRMTTWKQEDDGRKMVQQDSSDIWHGQLSRYGLNLLNQGYIESYLLRGLHESGGSAPERGVLPIKLEVDESKVNDANAYAVTMDVQHLTEEESTPAQVKSHTKDGEVVMDGLYRSNMTRDRTDDLVKAVGGREETREVIHAKYVIGCDGAHSWVRKQLGLTMEGEMTDAVYGVLDIKAITNFPGARTTATIVSPHGSILMIAREKKLMRFYVPMREVSPTEDGVKGFGITPDSILTEARKIMAPYTLDYTYCDWWTAYQIGQRVATASQDKHGRVFLAGDAVHTHSPKAGQGMNISMGDTHNLGWKLASVINGWMDASVLSTYQSERRKVAQDLIELDHKLTRAFSGQGSKDDVNSVYRFFFPFISGFGVHYHASHITAAVPKDVAASDAYSMYAEAINSDLKTVQAETCFASKLAIGKHFPSKPVMCQANESPVDLQRYIAADGRWRLFVFPGDISSDSAFARLNDLGERLIPLVQRYRVTRRRPVASYFANIAGERVYEDLKQFATMTQSLIDVLTVHCAARGARVFTDFHSTFFPLDERDGYDYEKIFVDTDMSEHSHMWGAVTAGSGKVYEAYGIDREKGALVIARPDQYTAWVGGLEDVEGVERFFAGALLESKEKNGVVVNGNGH